MSYDSRPSSSQRGYGWRWRKLRDAVPRTPCAGLYCGVPWRVDFVLDHIKPRRAGGSDRPDNLQWLCPDCHRRKSVHQDGALGHAKQAVIGCDADGMPIGDGHHWVR